MSTMNTRKLNHDIKKYVEAKKAMDAAKALVDAYKADILAALDAAGVDTYDGKAGSVKRTAYATTRIDSKKLKADAPDVYAAYATTSEAVRVTIKEA